MRSRSRSSVRDSSVPSAKSCRQTRFGRRTHCLDQGLSQRLDDVIPQKAHRCRGWLRAAHDVGFRSHGHLIPALQARARTRPIRGTTSGRPSLQMSQPCSALMAASRVLSMRLVHSPPRLPVSHQSKSSQCPCGYSAPGKGEEAVGMAGIEDAGAPAGTLHVLWKSITTESACSMP